MKANALLFSLLFSLAFFGCTEEPNLSIEPISSDEKPDGFVDSWEAIVLTDPPPPAPFRFLSGMPIDMNMVTVTTTGRESQVEATIIVAMGTVGNIDFNAGNAPGVMAATAGIEQALNTWQFTNNGWGQIKIILNFGSKKVVLNLTDMNYRERVKSLKSSFYSGFIGYRGQIKIDG